MRCNSDLEFIKLGVVVVRGDDAELLELGVLYNEHVQVDVPFERAGQGPAGKAVPLNL